jgi:hypothetical protein
MHIYVYVHIYIYVYIELDYNYEWSLITPFVEIYKINIIIMNKAKKEFELKGIRNVLNDEKIRIKYISVCEIQLII